MPEEIAVIIVISILGGFFMTFVRMILNYRKERLRITSAPVGQEDGMSESELKALMRDAVAEAMVPLEMKIEDLEAQLDAQFDAFTPQALLEAASSDGMLELDEEPEPEPEPARSRSATRRRRSR